MEEINEKQHMQMLNFNETKRKEWVSNRKPFSVLFELTAQCNMNCIHCYLQKKHSCEQLEYNKVIEILDILYDNGILFLTFTGGEILLRQDFTDIYLYAKKRGFLVELFTNGYLFNDDIISVLKEYPPLLVDISLYGANENTYFKITGIHGAFSKVIDNCKKLKKEGIRVSLKSPILKETFSEINAMQKLANDMEIPFVYTFEITPTIDKDKSTKKLQMPLCEILKHEFENYYEQIKEGKRKEGEINLQEIEKLSKNKCIYHCNVALNSFVIDYKGNMCPCMKLRHKGLKLSKNNYAEIWDSFSVYSRIKSSDTYMCRKCSAKYYCDICPAEMDFLYGDPEYRTLEMCLPAKIRKDFYEKKISFNEALKKASL